MIVVGLVMFINYCGLQFAEKTNLDPGEDRDRG